MFSTIDISNNLVSLIFFIITGTCDNCASLAARKRRSPAISS